MHATNDNDHVNKVDVTEAFLKALQSAVKLDAQLQ